MNIINSEQNHWIKKINALKKKKYREQYGQFVVEGIRICKEVIEKKAQVEGLFISKTLMENEEIKELANCLPGKVYIVDAKLLEKTLSTVTPQGIASIVNKPYWDIKNVLDTGKTFLVLDGVSDPGNLGTLIRTSLAAGIDGLFCLKGTVDIYNEKTLRSTMGAFLKLPVFYIDDVEWFKTRLSILGISIVVADIRASKYYFELAYPEKTALVLGSEAQGPLHIITGEETVKIPLSPDSESLNVAVAGSVIIYEIIRQKMVSVVK
ncbi:MAG: TrmH family RNA methyltransferase [Bacillota bacterium]